MAKAVLPSPERRHVSMLLLTGANYTLLAQGLIVGTVQARALGPFSRGELASVIATSLFALELLNFGTFFSTLNILSLKRFSETRVVGTHLLVCFVLGSAGAAVLAARRDLVSNAPQVRELLLLICIVIPFSLLEQPLLAFLTSRRDWKTNALFKSAPALLSIAVTVPLAITGSITLQTQVVLYVVADMFALSFVAWKCRAVLAIHADLGVVKLIWRFGPPSWLATILATANVSVDQIFLSHEHMVRELGLYAVAASGATVITPLSGALGQILLSRGRVDESAAGLFGACRLGIAVTCVLVVLLALMGPLGILVLFGDAYIGSIPLFEVLAAASIPLVAVTLLWAVAASTGWRKPRLISEGVGIVLTGLGLSLLVPRMGAMGAALTSLMAYTASAAVMVILFARHEKLRPRSVILPRRDETLILVRMMARTTRRTASRLFPR